MIKLTQGFLVIVAAAAVIMTSGCKSDSAFSSTATGTTGTSSTGTGTSTGTGNGTTQNIRIGHGTGAAFSQGTLAVGVTPLSAGGSTSLTVTLVDDSGNLYSTPVDVSFSSPCAGLGSATLTSPVTTSNGTAISTYVAKGCSGNDTVTASATVNGTVITAAATLNVLAPTLGSIQFVSATPETIALKGTGGAGLSSVSTVIFKVLDTTGGPAANQTVNFSLNTTAGGLALTPATATTDVSGTVQTVVQAGTVHTPVRVTATVAGKGISTQSDQLTVTTGVPDEDSFSLSAETLNPEAWGEDGTTVKVTARLADRFNNPVPDGTAVTFTAEGGSIDGSCTTLGGACSVTWTSQNPRPCGQELGQPTYQANPVLNSCLIGTGTNPAAPQAGAGSGPLGQPYGGRVTILATALGEESFVDNNGNGVFDDGDSFTDLPEAFVDSNENGSRDNNEDFVDFNQNGSYDGGDGKFNGLLCQDTTRCSSTESVNVRASLVLVMSGSDAAIAISPSSITIPSGGTAGVSAIVADLHNQPMPAGTTVAFSTTQGSISGTSSFTIPNTNVNNGLSYSATLKGAKPTTAQSGELTVTVTSPKGLITMASIPVTEGGQPSSDVGVAMSDSPDPVSNGSNVTYTVTVTNNGPDDATGVVLTDTLPSSGGSLVSATPSAGSCYGSATVTCPLGNLTSGASATVTVVIKATATGVLTNTAKVSSATTDPNSGNDTAGQNTTVN